MNMRTSKPASGNKFYTTKSKGGYSTCIKGKPTDACDVLANCVGYACGRFNEIIGSMKYPSLNCNAENFIERAKSLGLKISTKPTLGGIMVWKKGASLSGSDGAGHVAVVERIDSSNQIYTSESGYNSKAFWNTLRTNNNGRWGAGSGYTYRGCIVNPAIGEVTGSSSSSSSSSKVSVSKIQSQYNSKFGAILGKIAVDNSAGPDTKKHIIKAVQYEMNKQYGSGLDIDGSFGPKTKAAFLDLTKGCYGNITWLCQARFYCKGYDPNGLDSSYGNGMKTCVTNYQKQQGLKVDGILGKNTAYKLFN